MDKKPEMAMQAAKEGFVLTPAFAEILANDYEKQEVVLRLHFPDMVESLDFRREEKRLENFQFANEITRAHHPRDGRKAGCAAHRRRTDPR